MPIYRLISFVVLFAFTLIVAHWVNKPLVQAETAIHSCTNVTSSLLGECEFLTASHLFDPIIEQGPNRTESNVEGINGLFSLPVFNMYESPTRGANLFLSPPLLDRVPITKPEPDIFDHMYAVPSTTPVGRDYLSTIYLQEEGLSSVLTSSQNYELMSHLGGGSYAIAKQNNFVFLGIGPHVVILNVSDPNSPLLVGKTEYLPSYVTSIAVSGSYLYVGASGIHVFQITNLSQPIKVGFYSISATIWDITIQGQRAYVGGNYAGLLILNIANPHNLQFAGYYSGSLGQVYGIVVENNLAYLAAGSGLFIVNVANASSPYFVGYAHTPGTARGLSLAGNFAYVAAGFNSGLRIINIASPANPYEVGFINPEYSNATGVIVQNNIAYVVEDWNGLRTIDVSNPANPIELGFYYVRRGIRDVVISGSHLFAAAEASGLHVLQVGDPENPALIGRYEERPGIANAVAVHGHYAFVADDSAGIHTINFRDFYAPKVKNTYATPGSARALAVEGNYLYLADYFSVIIYDISDPKNPIEVGAVPASYATAIEVLDDIVYVADFNHGVRIIDASDPHHPVQIALWPTRANDLHVINNYVFVTTSWFSQGMHILDVSNPYAPFQVGFYDAMASTSGVVVKDNHAFITNWENSLHVVNVANVNNPFLVEIIGVSGGGRDVDIVDNYLHVGTTQGLWTYNISHPATPQLVGYYNTPGRIGRIQAKDNFVFTADLWGGLHVLCFTGFTPSASDSGLRPCPDGYKFSNGDSEWGKYPFGPAFHDFDASHMVNMLGPSQVCVLGIATPCIPTTTSLLWFEFVNYARNPGHCFGMSATTLRFHQGFDDRSIFQPDANLTHDLLLENVRSHIAYYQVMQWTNPVFEYRQVERINSTPQSVLDKVQTALSSNSPVMLALHYNNNGHAIVPYAVENVSNNVWHIKVYDNNQPGFNRHVAIDLNNNSWSYGGWNGDATTKSLYTIPLALLDAPRAIPNYLLVALMSGIEETRHLLLTDSLGRQLGFAAGHFVDEIPDAFANQILGGLRATEPVYVLPITDTYSIELNGYGLSESEIINLYKQGNNFTVRIDQISLRPTTIDTFVIDPEIHQLSYEASEPQEVTISLALDSETNGHHFRLINVDVGENQTISGQVISDSGLLAFNNQFSSGGVYSFSMTRAAITGLHHFQHSNIVVAETDTHYFDFANWDGSGALTVYIDKGSNGTFDETLELSNQYGLLFLPLISR